MSDDTLKTINIPEGILDVLRDLQLQILRGSEALQQRNQLLKFLNSCGAVTIDDLAGVMQVKTTLSETVMDNGGHFGPIDGKTG